MAQGVPGRLRPRIILTFRHYKGGRSSAKRTGRLYPRSKPWHSLSEAESTSGHMVLSGEPRKKSPVTPPGIDPGTIRLVAQRLNHYATSGPDYILITNLMHQLLFIHKIIFSSTCFEPQVLIFRRTQLYTCSIWYCHSLLEFVVACRYTA